MRVFHTLLLVLSLVVLPSAIAASKEGVFLGKQNDDVPCTCVFNKNRSWNPESYEWKGSIWICSVYKEDGTCTKVAKTGEALPTKAPEKSDRPTSNVFNKNRAWNPGVVTWEGEFWRCAEYREDGTCVDTIKARDPKETTFGGVNIELIDDESVCGLFFEKELRNVLILSEMDRYSQLMTDRGLWNDKDIEAIRAGESVIGMTDCGTQSLMGN